MHRHDAHAVAAFLEDGRLARLTGHGPVFELLDEPAERQPAARLVASRQLGDLHHVGQSLLAARTHDEAGVRACSLEQPPDRLGDRHVVPPPVRRPQHGQRLGDRRQPPTLGVRRPIIHPGGGTELGRNAERVETAEPLVVLEQRRILDREERPAQRREDGEIVVGATSPPN